MFFRWILFIIFDTTTLLPISSILQTGHETLRTYGGRR